MDKASEEFNKLSLEGKAKILLKNYYNGEKVCYSCNPGDLTKAWDYLEENDYVMVTGGTPKSGPGYGITGKGLIFIDD